MADPPPQTPPVQVSPVVQNWPSSQLVPFITGVNVSQLPSEPPESHDAVLHWSPAPEQSGALPPVHEPDWQVSPTLHASPSSQLVPSITGVSVSQLPSDPAVLHEAVLH